MQSPLTRLSRACELTEIRPDDKRRVDFDGVRGENLALKYARMFRLADPAKPRTVLFAGHRGIGKTSELLRLKKMLEEPVRDDPNFLVVYFDVNEGLDLNDLDLPDLLAYTAARVFEALKNADIPGFDAASQYLMRVWNDVTQTLGAEVKLEKADIKVPFASLAVEIKNRPNSRDLLRKVIEQQNTNLLNAVNDLLTMATVQLRETKRATGLVLLIDGLDKLAYRELDKTNTHDRLFCDRSEQLASLQAHVLYTVPISFLYSPKCVAVAQTFGGHPSPVPMIKLHEQRTAPPTPDTPGMKKMWEMIEKRCEFADVKIADVFDAPTTGHYLCELSGGHPRHLMMFIQAALVELDKLPITRVAAEKAVRNYANSVLREMPDGFWPKLRRFAAPQSEIPKDADHQLMLYLLHIFEYMNGEPWYEVNPVIRPIPRFNRAD